MPTVLIIDDEPQRLSTLQQVLGRSKGSEVDAILLDWVLPDVDGIELLRWIKSSPALSDLEVVIQSPEVVPEKIRAGIDYGAYYYLTRPTSPLSCRRSSSRQCRPAVRIAAACNDPEKGVGLFELMANAIEHGNLGITYEDKSRFLEEGTHQAEIRRRLELPENRSKRARIELERDQHRLRLRIRDACSTPMAAGSCSRGMHSICSTSTRETRSAFP